MSLVSVFLRIERNGVKIDSKVLYNYFEEFIFRLVELEKKAYEIVGEEFNFFFIK